MPVSLLPPSPMPIREAIPSDAAALASLSTQLGYPVAPGEMAERLLAVLNQANQSVLVAEEDGAVGGWLQVCSRESLESPPFAEVSGLVVDEAQRGRGVGRRLLNAAVHWAEERGYGRLRVRSNVVRTDAHRFYEREGFHLTKTQVVLDRLLER